VSSLGRYGKRVLPFVVSAIALGALFANVDLSAVVGALSWKMAATVAPTLLAYGAVTIALEAVSIMRLLGPTAVDFRATTAARIKCASYLLGIVNYALGVAALSVLLQRRAGIRLADAASVVLLISGLDTLVVLALAAAGLAASGSETPTLWVVALAVGGLGFFGGMALLRTPASLGPLERIRSLAFFDALRTTPLRRISEVMVLRIAFAASFIAMVGVVFAAFDIAPDLSELVVGILVVAVVAALPIAVAGLGTGQIAFVEVFRDLASRETLLVISLVLSTGMITLRVGMGLLFAREFAREALHPSPTEPA
jgi:hypothetical protein